MLAQSLCCVYVLLRVFCCSLLGQRLVYEVALMVDADVLAQQQQHQLSGLRLVLASEQDQADDEFYGRAKVKFEHLWLRAGVFACAIICLL